MLGLPSWRQLREMDPEVRELLYAVLMDLHHDSHARAEESWRSGKGPMAVYWKAVGVYAGHLARSLRWRGGR